MNGEKRTTWSRRLGLTSCRWMAAAMLIAGAPLAYGVTYEQLINETAPPVSEAEVERLKARLVGAYPPVTFINTQYLVNAKPPGGPVFLKPTGSITNARRPPRYNVLEWQLEVEGRMAVNGQSIAEIGAYRDRLEREVDKLDEAVRALSKESRAAEGEAKNKLRERLKENRSKARKSKRDLETTKVMHAVFEDAMRDGIAELHFALVRATSAVALQYDEPSDTVANVARLTESFALREPLLLFDGGFYQFGAKLQGRFKQHRRLPQQVNTRTRAVLNDTYDRWGKRCAMLRQHRASLPDQGLVERCATTRDQLLQWPGVIERSTHLYWGETALPAPTPAQENLYLRPTRPGAEMPPAWPPLDYMRVLDCSTVELDYEKIRARGFADTLWSFERQQRYVSREQIAGSNWDAALATRYRTNGALGAAIFLRADGVIGIDNVFDDQHRWAYGKEGITLRFFGGEITLTIDPQYDGIMWLNHLRAQDDRLYTYRARLFMQYPSRPPSQYTLHVDYRNSLNRKAMPRPRNLCDSDGQPTTVARRQPVGAPTPATTPQGTQGAPRAAALPVTATPGLQPLANTGFEAPRVAQYEFAMQHWQGERHGVVTPPATMFPDGLAPEGRQVAYLSKPSSWMAQSLPHRPAPNWRYTVQVWAGNRLEAGFAPGHYHLELLAGDVVVASQRFATAAKGEFAPASLSYEAPDTPPRGTLTVRMRNEDTRQINFDMVRLYAYPRGSGETPPALTWENRRTKTETPVVVSAGAAAETVGFWDYDAVDGQAVPAGLTLRKQSGNGLGKRWTHILQLKMHDRLRPRNRTLWPVELKRGEKRVCINYPGYPSYTAFIDFADDTHDGVYAFGPCASD